MILKDKVCFITGSTRGIGWETAREFARQGATVILNGRNAEVLEDRRRELTEAASGGDVFSMVADSADPAAVKACYPQIFKRYKRLDVLVNNAGIMQDALLGMISLDSIRLVMDTNLVGPLLHMQEAARLMGRNGAGSIVNMSSIMGRFGNAGQAVYSASKAGIIGMTLAAAKELAPKNIRVNAVAPGFIQTALTDQLTPDKYREHTAGIRMGRVGSPADVAQAILFLASDMSSYVTGQVLGVDGGMMV